MGKKKPKKKNSGRKKRNNKLKTVLKEGIVTLFRASPKKTFNYKQVAAQFQVTDSPTRKLIMDILNELKKSEQLEEVQRGKFRYKGSRSTVTGKLQVTMKGTGYVLVEDMEEDIYIDNRYLGNAIDGDLVNVFIFPSRQGRRQPEGEITKVLERGRKEIVGKIEISPNFAFVVPDNPRIHIDFFIPKNKIGDCKEGDMVLVRYMEWPDDGDNPIGEVVKIFGQRGDQDAEMHAILAEFGLPAELPDHVIKAADEIPDKISSQEAKKRRDMRPVTTFTIDPDDAKDFDDALSFKKLENGNYEIGIHIADVSHYVKEGSVIDEEAYQRATSVYLVDRVVPMLPERLSNEICSLRPNEDKCCFSAVFEMDDSAKVVNEWFGRTLIHSDTRFTYDQAQEIIEGGKGKHEVEIRELNRLAKIMRKDRITSGALEIVSTEVKFKLDEKGNPLGVYAKVMKDANKLIEEFMLLANRRVATLIGKKKEGVPQKTFVYRIHDEPDPEKLQDLVKFVQKFGYQFSNVTPQNAARRINQLLKKIKDDHQRNVIQTMAIRSMAKAVYSTDNIGHFGLGFRYYTHFTSPIRRYPDLIVHRLMARYLDNPKSQVDDGLIDRACVHSSNQEKMAQDAERSSIRYMQVRFMEDHVGDVFEAVITGVTEWGLFVELKDIKCEGLVHISTLKDDHYIFDDENFRLIGRHFRATYDLGDEVKVILKGTDLLKKQMDFQMYDEPEV